MKNLQALAWATLGTIISTTFLTLAAELSETFKTTLKSLASHHWIAKGIIAILIFTLVYLTTSQVEDDSSKIKRNAWIVTLSALIGFIILLGFFVIEFMV